MAVDLAFLIAAFCLIYLFYRWVFPEQLTWFWQGLTCLFAAGTIAQLAGDHWYGGVVIALLFSLGSWKTMSIFFRGPITAGRMSQDEGEEMDRRIGRDLDRVRRPLRGARGRLRPQSS